jgi:hypothetical protein
MLDAAKAASKIAGADLAPLLALASGKRLPPPVLVDRERRSTLVWLVADGRADSD